VRRSLNYAVRAVGRECSQLILHLEPAGRLFAGTYYRQRCITQAPRAAHLCTGFGGGAEFLGGGTYLLRRGVEGLNLSALLRR
jgi:hypothetical protein